MPGVVGRKTQSSGDDDVLVVIYRDDVLPA